jgi:hypothetical protein
MHLFVHATAYGELRRSFTPLHSRVASALVRALITGASVLGSVRVKALPDRNGISELSQLSGTHGVPYGLHDSLCTLRHACSMRVLKVTGVVCVRVSPFVPQRPAYRILHMSAHDATLDTGGWLALTRQGLSPCKMHQASPGALTLACTGAERAAGKMGCCSFSFSGHPFRPVKPGVMPSTI